MTAIDIRSDRIYDFGTGFPIDPTDVRWGAPIFPPWVKSFRPHQMIADIEIVNHFRNGADIVVVQAPTGSGKTLIADSVRRLLNVPRCLYVANTKGLQDQMAADFAFAKVLKGRSNYPTLDYPERFQTHGVENGYGLSCADCLGRPGRECPHCDPNEACPYKVAKNTALHASMAITNTAYFLSEANGPGRFSDLPFVVVDEADTLESIAMSQIEMVISPREQTKYGIEQPQRMNPVGDGVVNARKQTWQEWIDEIAAPAYERARATVKDAEDVKSHKELQHVESMLVKLDQVRAEIDYGNVVYDPTSRGDIVFKPIHVDRTGPSMIWKHASKWLLMSATMIDPMGEMQRLGALAAHKNVAVVDVPSTFPPENSPVHIKPMANMTYKERETAWPKMAAGVCKVLAKHPDDRVLVHTVSYDFSKYLREQIADDRSLRGRKILTYYQARDRDYTLEQFRHTHGGVLLAPSMDRGVDLPEDDCRVVIVTKMPFMSTKDKRVQARLHSHDGQLWYTVQTIRSLVQMCGRATRSERDRSDVYVLDEQFMSLWSKNKNLFPKWFTERFDWSGGDL